MKIPVDITQIPFTPIRFHFDPFLLLTGELFFLPFHTAQFSDKNEYLSVGFTPALKHSTDRLFLKTRQKGLQL